MEKFNGERWLHRIWKDRIDSTMGADCCLAFIPPLLDVLGGEDLPTIETPHELASANQLFVVVG